jgi:hypothetical protein
VAGAGGGRRGRRREGAGERGGVNTSRHRGGAGEGVAGAGGSHRGHRGRRGWWGQAAAVVAIDLGTDTGEGTRGYGRWRGEEDDIRV